MNGRTGLRRLAAAVLVLGLAGCGMDFHGNDTVYPEDDNRKTAGGAYEQSGSIFGDEGLTLFGGGGNEKPTGAGAGIGVNSFLWRASLDTISFMPLVSADPFGGVIITDWYSPPEAKLERFKVNVYILGRDLRADGVRASVFRQLLDSNGTWIDAEVEASTPTELENAILARARELRIASIQ